MEREIRFKTWHEFPRYRVGDDGSVWSDDYNHTGRPGKLSQNTDQDGYKYVFLVVGGRRYKRSVHRMVAISFVPNPSGKPQVNHRNGIRHDNTAENLEWVTSRENTIHGYRVNGRKASQKVIESSRVRFTGESNPKAKINEATVLSIRRLRAAGNSLKDIAERHGISVAHVSAIATYRVWRTT